MVPKLYRIFYEKRLFSLDEAAEHYSDKQLARNAVSYMKKQGYLKQIKAGLYCVVPFEYQGKDYSPDLVFVGSRITEPYYFSHQTALRIYGFVTQFDKVVITSPSRFRKFKFENMQFINVYTKHFFGYKEHFYKENLNVYISDQERTFIDCLNKLGLSGGPVRVCKTLSNFGFINYLLLMEYLERMENKTLMAKVGFTLSLLKDRWDVPEDILKDLQRRVNDDTVYILDRDMLKGTGELVPEWNLVIPKGFWDLSGFRKL